MCFVHWLMLTVAASQLGGGIEETSTNCLLSGNQPAAAGKSAFPPLSNLRTLRERLKVVDGITNKLDGRIKVRVCLRKLPSTPVVSKTNW